ncbi:nuclear receptor-binding protein 2-like [Bufo gargarizans]|uniref:nuclear receptor-binding protein 2-like n=1 Tax=Bufo gargarizans TaxID=30331 RepID=UPI001CF2F864|nr:nuclear receptor-binding protein 2-like [Bufo gargarizans]
MALHVTSAQSEMNPEKQKDEESEDESEVLEESPCGRWHKRKEQVNQGNMPGIESTFLAMDTEEGVEVVWNELQFTDRRVFKSHEDKIRNMFQKLMVVDHPNVVKFHKYWLDVKETSARVVFITEYVSSGSLRQFLKKTKKNRKTMNARAWKRWCTQILSALSYLHSCDPVFIHGNLTNDTIFIQHNGLIKIGSGKGSSTGGVNSRLKSRDPTVHKLRRGGNAAAFPWTLSLSGHLRAPPSHKHRPPGCQVVQMHCNLERREDKARIHLTLYLKLEDKLHRHLSCDLLPNESSQTLASELVHYGFISEEDCQKTANFLEDALHKYRPPLN